MVDMGLYGWTVHTLPQLEQQALYNSVNFETGVFDQFTRPIFAFPTAITACETTVRVFLCPSDADAEKKFVEVDVDDHVTINHAQTSYGGSTNTYYPYDSLFDGIYTFRCRGLAEVTDGASNSIAFGEQAVGPGPPRHKPGSIPRGRTGYL